jgi:Ni,Fe-hydrogenase III small subunit/Pyruvate/2-oxoacid:ferredoxin oxidoreductase delta subunit
MLRIIRERLRQRYRTMRYPGAEPPPLPPRFRGVPVLTSEPCPDGCAECIEACPTDAVSRGSGARLTMDLGRCIFCGECAAACPEERITFSRDPRMAVRKREHLVIGPDALRLAETLGADLRRLLGRALRLRQVSAGGCNACEADANVLTTVGWDIGRFGIQFVASPRHADGLLVTGPVTTNMRRALEKTYEAVPDPKIVIASGACAISGGIYRGSPAAHGGVSDILPVDLFVPGCPPHPLTLLDGLLRLIGRKGRYSDITPPPTRISPS